MTFKANSKNDIELLSILIRANNGSWQLAADICSLGLMNFKEPFIQDVIKQTREKGELGNLYTFFYMVNEIDPTIITDFIDSSAEHAISGNDTEDEDSVGGWSQREIDLLVTKRKWQ